MIVVGMIVGMVRFVVVVASMPIAMAIKHTCIVVDPLGVLWRLFQLPYHLG